MLETAKSLAWYPAYQAAATNSTSDAFPVDIAPPADAVAVAVADAEMDSEVGTAPEAEMDSDADTASCRALCICARERLLDE